MSTRSRDAVNPPVSRRRLAAIAGLAALVTAFGHWFGAPRELVWLMGLGAVANAVLALMPDRVRRLLAWDLNLW